MTPTCTTGSSGRDRSATATPSAPATTRGRSPTSTGEQRLRPPPRRGRRRRRRPGGGDDDQPASSSSSPSTRISKLGAAAVLLSPAWKARRGRPRRSTSPGPSTRSPTAPAVALLAERLGADARHRPRRRRRRSPPPLGRDRGPLAGRGRRATDEAILVFSSGTTGLPEGGAPHPPLDRARPPRTGCDALGLGPDDRFQVATPAVAHPRPAQPARRRRGRARPCACTAGSTSTRCCAASSPSA